MRISTGAIFIPHAVALGHPGVDEPLSGAGALKPADDVLGVRAVARVEPAHIGARGHAQSYDRAGLRIDVRVPPNRAEYEFACQVRGTASVGRRGLWNTSGRGCHSVDRSSDGGRSSSVDGGGNGSSRSG
ncbi:hypothetical protein B0H17DRAFT_1037440, partial [Mycena rosella]